VLNSFTVEAVPEPATFILLSFGGLSACIIRRVSRR
jgi:hypothetical protein